MILLENIFYLTLTFAIVFIPFSLWFLYIKVPQIIRAKIAGIPDFNTEKIHFGKDAAVAFDFAIRSFVYSDTSKAFLFPAAELIGFSHHCLETPTNRGSIKEADQHLRIRLRNDNHPEIKVKFHTRSDAQLCENSFERLYGEEISFQENISTEKDTGPAQVFTLYTNPTPQHVQQPDSEERANVEPEAELTPKNADVMNRLIALLADAGFSYDDASGKDKKMKFNRATDLIFSEYEKLIGHPLQHKGQQDIERALLPFFERRSGEPKSVGFTAGTLKNYVSENKTAWEEKTKINL